MATKQAQLKKQAYASNLKSRALSVLIYLIDRSNQELTCFPAISTMAEQLHISVSTVKRALRELVDGGYISKEARFREKNRGQSSNLYTLVLQQKKDGVRNNNDSDMREDVKPATDNFSDASEEQNQKISAVMPQGEVEHISFESLKRNREEPEEKETLGDCRSEKEETVLIRYLLKGFNIKQKKKKIVLYTQMLTDCTRAHFGIGSFRICFRRLHIWREGQVNEDEKNLFTGLLFIFVMDGGGGQFECPLNYSG